MSGTYRRNVAKSRQDTHFPADTSCVMTPGHTTGYAPIVPLNLLHVTSVRLRSGFFRVYSACCAATVRLGAIILSLLSLISIMLIPKDINLQKLSFVCQNVNPSPQNTAYKVPTRTQPNQHNHLYLHLYITILFSERRQQLSSQKGRMALLWWRSGHGTGPRHCARHPLACLPAAISLRLFFSPGEPALRFLTNLFWRATLEPPAF